MDQKQKKNTNACQEIQNKKIIYFCVQSSKIVNVWNNTSVSKLSFLGEL